MPPRIGRASGAADAVADVMAIDHSRVNHRLQPMARPHHQRIPLNQRHLSAFTSWPKS
jgi:hypothetical protein